MAYAFRMYRDYDGRGGQFGDLYVESTGTDQGVVSIYGSIRRDTRLAVILINKVAFDLTCNLAVQNSIHRGATRVYRYSNADLSRIIREPDETISGTTMPIALPASSITLLVMPAGMPGDLNGSGAIDQADVALFRECVSGAGASLVEPSVCSPADFDGDQDVEQIDFGALQRCMTEPYAPLDPGCGNLFPPP